MSCAFSSIFCPFPKDGTTVPVTFKAAPVVILFNRLIMKLSQVLQQPVGYVLVDAIIQGNELVVAKSAYPSHHYGILPIRLALKESFYFNSFIKHFANIMS